jgi:hypothetical protein
MAWCVAPMAVAVPRPSCYWDPWVVVGEGLLTWGLLELLIGTLLRRCEPPDRGLHISKLALDVAKQLHDIGYWAVPVGRVPVHAPPVIGGYPRGTSSGAGREFWLVSRSPSGAEVLRARPAVTAGRAYESSWHGCWIRRRTGRTRCLWRCPTAVPVGGRLRL